MEEQSKIIYEAPQVETWIIPNVPYRGKSGSYEIVGEMIPSMTQDQLAEKYGLETPDAPLIWAIASRAYNLRAENPKEAESLRNFLKTGFRQYPNTSTRIIYNPKGNDEILHNYGTSNQYSIKENVVGEDGYIKKISDKNILESLLGNQDVNKINEVSNWINETESYIWRLNSKPSEKNERVFGFDASGSRLVLGCDWSSSYRYPAFRVLRVD